MAARRLLIVMVILLVTSTVAAALVPPPPERDSTTEDTTSPRTSPVPAGGKLVRAKVDADARRQEEIRLPLGDQLALTVTSRKAGQVEIPRLGLLEDVLPLSPARFDILAARPGRFDVRLVEPDRRIATVEVDQETAKRERANESRRRAGRSAGTSRSR